MFAQFVFWPMKLEKLDIFSLILDNVNNQHVEKSTLNVGFIPKHIFYKTKLLYNNQFLSQSLEIVIQCRSNVSLNVLIFSDRYLNYKGSN